MAEAGNVQGRKSLDSNWISILAGMFTAVATSSSSRFVFVLNLRRKGDKDVKATVLWIGNRLRNVTKSEGVLNFRGGVFGSDFSRSSSRRICFSKSFILSSSLISN